MAAVVLFNLFEKHHMTRKSTDSGLVIYHCSCSCLLRSRKICSIRDPVPIPAILGKEPGTAALPTRQRGS